MAISETTLKDVMLMLIEEQNNAKGGVLGKKLEAVVVDPASNWPLFAEKARELLTQDKVAVVFGCWTSVSRKSVLPVFEELNGLLFYPVQYEGEELLSATCSTPAPRRTSRRSRRRLPDERRKAARSAGCCSAPTTSIRAPPTRSCAPILKSQGRRPTKDIMINYTPFGHSDWQTIVADIKKFGSAGKKTAWSRPSTATPTCRSTRSWATRA
jgi:urea transport system substrate-binding protein